MRHRTVGKFRISRLGLGTVQFGLDYGFTKKMSQPHIDALLDACRRSGVNFLDTARDYGDSEAKIGDYLKRHPGGDWVIATKIKNIPEAICSDERTLEKHVTASIRASTGHLGRPLQILQLHNTEENIVKNPHLWTVIAKLKRRGLFREFGVSFYDPEIARPVLREHHHLIRFIQAPFNIFDGRFAGMFSWLSKKKIAFISRSTFLKGVLGASENLLPNELKPLRPFKAKLQTLAGSVGLTVSESALLFAYQTKGVTSSLIGVKSAEELEINIRALKRSAPLKKILWKIARLERPDAQLIDPRKWKQL